MCGRDLPLGLALSVWGKRNTQEVTNTGQHGAHYSTFMWNRITASNSSEEMHVGRARQEGLWRASWEVEWVLWLEVMMAEGAVNMAGARGCQGGGTFQGLTVRAQAALWANDHFTRWRRNAQGCFSAQTI